MPSEQVKVWNDVVTRLPADWFPRETHALLTEYCRACVTARFIGAALESYAGFWVTRSIRRRCELTSR